MIIKPSHFFTFLIFWVDDWQLVEDEQVRFEVSMEDFCENTGRECKVVERVMFYRTEDGCYKSDHPIEEVALN